MIIVTIAVAAIIATSVSSYLAIMYKQRAQDSSLKYDSIKEFADNAGSKILRLESENKELAEKIVQLMLVEKNVEVVKAETSVAEEPKAQPKPKRSKRRFYKAKKDSNN